jgi:prephenate dehydrogenase
VGAFSTIAVVGLGLVGGSFAAACKRLDPAPYILGLDTDPDTLAFAVDQGMIDDWLPLDSLAECGPGGIHAADLVVLATPAAAVLASLSALGSSEYTGVVTDVTSTKREVQITAEETLGSGASFIGGHPMAGSEQSGIRAARPDLFDGAYYILTPTRDTDMDAYRRLHSFITRLGARVIAVDAAEHDQAVAIISHVPHVTASALVDLAQAHAGEGGELLRLAAGGFKDTTRIAAGSPDLWTGICLDNAEALTEGLDELREVLGEFADRLRACDAEGVREWLARAAEVRRSLPAQWVPATERLTELLIPVIDRPGVVSEVTAAVGRAGCNIEAIEIDHQSEDTAVLVLVLTDEGDIEQLLDDLTRRGYDPRLRSLEG